MLSSIIDFNLLDQSYLEELIRQVLPQRKINNVIPFGADIGTIEQIDNVVYIGSLGMLKAGNVAVTNWTGDNSILATSMVGTINPVMFSYINAMGLLGFFKGWKITLENQAQSPTPPTPPSSMKPPNQGFKYVYTKDGETASNRIVMLFGEVTKNLSMYKNGVLDGGVTPAQNYYVSNFANGTVYELRDGDDVLETVTAVFPATPDDCVYYPEFFGGGDVYAYINFLFNFDDWKLSSLDDIESWTYLADSNVYDILPPSTEGSSGVFYRILPGTSTGGTLNRLGVRLRAQIVPGVWQDTPVRIYLDGGTV